MTGTVENPMIDVRAMAQNMARVAKKIQDATNAVPQVSKGIRDAITAVPQPQGPRVSDNGRGPLPHLSKPKHTTSWVLFTSVPEEMAPDISAALEYLTDFSNIRGVTNKAVLQAIINDAKAAGWEPVEK